MKNICNAKYDVAEMCKWAGDNYACNFPEFCGSKAVNAPTVGQNNPYPVIDDGHIAKPLSVNVVTCRGIME